MEVEEGEKVTVTVAVLLMEAVGEPVSVRVKVLSGEEVTVGVMDTRGLVGEVDMDWVEEGVKEVRLGESTGVKEGLAVEEAVRVGEGVPVKEALELGQEVEVEESVGAEVWEGEGVVVMEGCPGEGEELGEGEYDPVPVTVGVKVTVRVDGGEMVRVGVESGLRLRVEVPLSQLEGESVGEAEGEKEAVEVTEVVACKVDVAMALEDAVGVLRALPVAKEAVGEPLVVLVKDPESVDDRLPVELPLPLPYPPPLLGVEVLDTTSEKVRVMVGRVDPEAVEVTETVADILKKDALPVTLGVIVGQIEAVPVGEAVPVTLIL